MDKFGVNFVEIKRRIRFKINKLVVLVGYEIFYVWFVVVRYIVG